MGYGADGPRPPAESYRSRNDRLARDRTGIRWTDPLEAQLAAKVVDFVPCAELVRFTNTGTEADLLAVRLARAFTGPPKIIKFEGHYHGWGDGLAVSIKPPFVQADGRTTVQTQPESLGMTPSSYDDVIVLPWNDLDAIEPCLNWQGQTVAGVIMEPVMLSNESRN